MAFGFITVTSVRSGHAPVTLNRNAIIGFGPKRNGSEGNAYIEVSSTESGSTDVLLVMQTWDDIVVLLDTDLIETTYQLELARMGAAR